MDFSIDGEAMHSFLRELFPICRSVTGNGTRETLRRIASHLPEMTIHEVPSGTPVLDWTIPDEWNIRSARLIGPDGNTIADFNVHNLHVVNYSIPVDFELDLQELQPHLHSLPEQPDAIPYVTSYYERNWGFCVAHRVRQQLKPGRYRAIIDSSLAPGHMTYGEYVFPGRDNREVFFSTYVCHPSMANNELSGPVVATWLAKWVSMAPRRYTYRFVFVPETIGSITYVSRNLSHLQAAMIAGFNLSCVGDDRAYSYLPSRDGHTLADRTALHVLRHTAPDFRKYTWLDRGSDERQYCSPGADLPVCSIMRTKYGAYPEYHTSLDDLSLVTSQGLNGALAALVRCIQCLEMNDKYRAMVIGEPQLGRRGLYPTRTTLDAPEYVRNMLHLLTYADGKRDLLDIAETIGVPVWKLQEIIANLLSHSLLERV